jgi:hypothetical protein
LRVYFNETKYKVITYHSQSHVLQIHIRVNAEVKYRLDDVKFRLSGNNPRPGDIKRGGTRTSPIYKEEGDTDQQGHLLARGNKYQVTLQCFFRCGWELATGQAVV